MSSCLIVYVHFYFVILLNGISTLQSIHGKFTVEFVRIHV